MPSLPLSGGPEPASPRAWQDYLDQLEPRRGCVSLYTPGGARAQESACHSLTVNPRQPACHVVPKCYQVTTFSPPNYNREKNGEAVSEVLLAGEPSPLGGKGSFADGKMALLEDSCRQPVFSWQVTLYLLYASSCPGVGRAGQQGLRLTGSRSWVRGLLSCCHLRQGDGCWEEADCHTSSLKCPPTQGWTP